MTITIPEIYLASCISFALGILVIIGLAYALAAIQRHNSQKDR